MGFLGGLTKTISGVAKTALGSVSKVRSIMNFNPSLTGLLLPPQVSLGLKAASTIGGLVGIKVPTADDLLGFASGKLDSVLGGIRNKVKQPLNTIEALLKQASTFNLDAATKTLLKTINIKGLNAEELLDKIAWLL